MSNCDNCFEGGVIPAYRVTQTIYERNTIPCIERVNGMIVTVVGEDNSYKQYILKGGDPCVNENWKEYGLDKASLSIFIGHETVPDIPQGPITSSELNSKFPEALEGFRVTYTSLNTTFMKIFNNQWIMSGNILITNN